MAWASASGQTAATTTETELWAAALAQGMVLLAMAAVLARVSWATGAPAAGWEVHLMAVLRMATPLPASALAREAASKALAVLVEVVEGSLTAQARDLAFLRQVAVTVVPVDDLSVVALTATVSRLSAVVPALQVISLAPYPLRVIST